MQIPLIGVGDKIKSSLINALIGKVNNIALIGIIPTGVAGSGVTVSSGGSVSFANASSVSVAGVFSGSYANYRIVWNIPSQTANADLEMRLAANGNDSTTANYSYLRGYDGLNTTSRTVSGVTAASSWFLTAGASSTQTNDGYMDLFGPASSSYTAGLAQAVVRNTVPNMYTTSTNLNNITAAAFDGFSLFPASGTMSGTVRIYGYNDLT